MQHQQTFLPLLPHRFHALIWSCLDADLYRTAVFYADRYFCIDNDNHDARHLYATALLRSGQTHSAMHLVNLPLDKRCSGCSELKARCCSILGRHRQAREALEESIRDPAYTSIVTSREARPFPEEAVLHCRAGSAALKGNLRAKAISSYSTALSLNPMLWEAFEGLCSLGAASDIEDLFPPRPPPVKRTAPEEPPTIFAPPPSRPAVPIATGAGFFTPDAPPLARGWKPELPIPFRMGPRDSLATVDSSFYGDNSMQIGQPFRARQQTSTSTLPPPPGARPLSSADEAGPVPKRQRSVTSSRPIKPPSNPKPTTTGAGVDDNRRGGALKKPALSGAPVSRTGAAGKAEGASKTAAAGARRSTRLLSGTGSKQTHAVKHPPRRRQGAGTLSHSRSKSMESDMDEDMQNIGDPGYSPSPPSIAHSPRSETSPSPSNWTQAHETAAQEAFEIESADLYIYDLMRLFASATRALAAYDSTACLDELEKLPYAHRRSAWVMSMVGRAHYEKVDYTAAERAFQTARSMDPYRLWDMEVYSTLLWHLQRNVELSFLAQELVTVDPRSPQAWIAVGNCFSLQKERTQALTCFRRAAQLDPGCAYAYTLSGHESIDEDLEKAISFFQSALQADARHYNAWYGLGTCYLRMSKIRQAEYHYRKASEIHPGNAVLLGCVGMAVERRGDREGAFGLFDEAVRIAPENALVRYRRAKLLIAQKQYELAVKDLEFLRDSSPEESNVVFQLAKVYRLLGDEVKAAQLLAVARDVSPKSMNKIKKLMETVKDGDETMDEG